MQPEYRPAIIRIIFTHYVTFLAALTPTVLWFFFFIDYMQGDVFISENNGVLYLLTVLGVGITLWNVVSISSIINNGQRTTAVIHSTGFFRGRGTIEFIYTFQGERYKGRNTVMKNQRTGSLDIGSKVEVFVSHNNPKKAVIAWFYTD